MIRVFAAATKEKAYLDSLEKVLLENVHPQADDISYTCLLIPCLPSYQLKDDLAERLPEWVQEICASSKWSVEFITVNVDYFQWGLRVSPSTQTSQFMQMIRETTSKLILAAFESIRNESSVSDFWAPGYLVVSGTRPYANEMIEQYIRMSRRQQEFIPPDLRGRRVRR